MFREQSTLRCAELNEDLKTEAVDHLDLAATWLNCCCCWQTAAALSVCRRMIAYISLDKTLTFTALQPRLPTFSLISVSSFSQMWWCTSTRARHSAVAGRNEYRTPRSNWKSWRRNTRQTNSSPRTRGGGSPPQLTCRSGRSPSGSRTGGWRRRSSWPKWRTARRNIHVCWWWKNACLYNIEEDELRKTGHWKNKLTRYPCWTKTVRHEIKGSRRIKRH